MNFVLDTNIIIHYIRKDEFAKNLDANVRPFDTGNLPVVPIVVFGELKSIAIQNNWGEKKLTLLDDLLFKVLRADITLEIVSRYAEIDAFSQNKLANQPLNLTARNMGKNDLWIAATASVLNSYLLTTDPDFNHLNGVFLNVRRVVI